MSSTVLDYSTDQAVKRVCVVNRLKSVTLTDNEILNVCKQIQDALRNEFMKYHGFSAKLYYCPRKVQEPNNMWNILDIANGAGYLGYYDANEKGIPQGKAFVQTAMRSNAKCSDFNKNKLCSSIIIFYILQLNSVDQEGFFENHTKYLLML